MKTPQKTEKTQHKVEKLYKEPLKMQVKVIIPYMLIVAGLVFVTGLFAGYFGGIVLRDDMRSSIITDIKTASK